MDINPIILSIPIFFILIGIELVVERFSHRKLYTLPDSIANMSCGITSQLSGLFMSVLGIGVFVLVYNTIKLFDLTQSFLFSDGNRTWLYWLCLFLLTDLAYYWAHRMSHEVNLFWGGHVVHHQSEEYNLSVALRQSSFQTVWTFAFSLPIALIGFAPGDFVLVSALNTLYQFWIHTETIKKMGWFEYIFNTPSHHRVHHGRNPKYIDKNHAGSLIIWDKMFGTFEPETEKAVYGITKPINSWNAVWANFDHYSTMASELKTIPSLKDKIRYMFHKPGWLPEHMGGQRPVPEVDLQTYKKYTTPAPIALNYYVLFQYIICLGGVSFFLFNKNNFSIWQQAGLAALISLVVVNCGVLFEDKKWVVYAEWFRIISYPVTFIVFALLNQWPLYGSIIAIVYMAISAVWFYLVMKKINASKA